MLTFGLFDFLAGIFFFYAGLKAGGFLGPIEEKK